MTNTQTYRSSTLELRALLDEIRRYLEAVDEFRRLGCEPRWRSEGVRS